MYMEISTIKKMSRKQPTPRLLSRFRFLAEHALKSGFDAHILGDTFMTSRRSEVSFGQSPIASFQTKRLIQRSEDFLK